MHDSSTLLLEAARRGDLHHSIILHGTDSGRLESLAVRLAKTLVCEKGSTGDDCTACSKVERDIHPDVKRVSPTNERKMIAVEQIREIVGEAAMRPYEASTKVFIIQPVDCISTAGANAMLKTLEEPQSRRPLLDEVDPRELSRFLPHRLARGARVRTQSFLLQSRWAGFRLPASVNESSEGADPLTA